ncbi:MAG TPA: RnfABCDGE type electron transport complex subunit D, partial [Thermoanaerobaculia bacterium]|nr:RnfABCDGE type electron transport complex subunit D [Thermoanaerobaculia bacterium]
LAGAAAAAVVANLLDPATPLTVLHHLFAGALFFCAFFIATDPVTSPLSPRGRAVFGFGVGVLVVLIRTLSSYPEGVVFAILLMNSVTPLINRGTVPKPFGGAVELPGGAK